MSDDKTMTEIEPPISPQPAPQKRTLSPEHLRKLTEGRERWQANHPKAESTTRARPSRGPKTNRVPDQNIARPAAGPKPRRGVSLRVPDAGPAPQVKPFAFPKPQRWINPEGHVPRLVVLGDVQGILEQFWPLILARFPFARREYLKPALSVMTRGEVGRLYRTDEALAMFELRRMDWRDPRTIVTTVFVIGDERDGASLLAAARDWAIAIRAAKFIDADGKELDLAGTAIISSA